MFPSLSKSQLHETAFSDKSINWTEKGAYPLVTLALKSATGKTGCCGLETGARGSLSVILSNSSIYVESIIPSPSASVAVWENPVPSGFAQKLPPMYGPPTIFLPRVFGIFQVVSMVLIFALRKLLT